MKIFLTTLLLLGVLEARPRTARWNTQPDATSFRIYRLTSVGRALLAETTGTNTVIDVIPGDRIVLVAFNGLESVPSDVVVVTGRMVVVVSESSNLTDWNEVVRVPLLREGVEKRFIRARIEED